MESLKNLFSDRKNIVITVLAVIIICSFVSILTRCPRSGYVYPEMFDPIAPEGEMQEMQELPDKNQPYVDAKTGSLLDGPGFEQGHVDGVSQEVLQNIPSNYYFLDDGASGEMSVQHNLCSKSCCSEQWPTPFKQKSDPFVCSNKDKFTPSRMFCNNSFQDSGCLCLTKSQSLFLNNRGGNGREFF